MVLNHKEKRGDPDGARLIPARVHQNQLQSLGL
jgi:hypothetical protein